MTALPEHGAAQALATTSADLSVDEDGRPTCRMDAPLRWHDIDAVGHVNHTVYHELLEEVRYLLLHPLMTENSMFVLVRVELDYRAEMRRTDEYVTLVGRVASVGEKSVTVEHELLKPDGSVSAAGRSILVAFDMTARRARPLTADERTALGD